jgi:hypothetical protein
MRYRILLPLAALLAGTVAAQTREAAPQYILRGIARDSLGQPLDRTVVTAARVQTVTDATGNFALVLPKPGRVRVTFERDGVRLGQVIALVGRDTVPAVALRALPNTGIAGALRGDVVDSAGRPVADAEVEVVTALMSTRTDIDGRFEVRGLSPARHLVRVRRLGFAPTYLMADLDTVAALQARITVQKFSGQNLGTVVVRRILGPAYINGFLTRLQRRSGWGTLLSQEEIAKRGATRVSSLFYSMRGFHVRPGPYSGDIIMGRGNCPASITLNGMPFPLWGESVDNMINVSDVVGVEAYPSAIAVPPELAWLSQGCGTVGIWTR